MRRLAALIGLTIGGMAGGAMAGTAYVTDDLVLGVYTEPNGAGTRLATLHSGASVETLEGAAAGSEYTQVRLTDGRSGWVKSSYLTTRAPAQVRVKQLEEELDRSRATTPELAAAAARSELESLRGALAERDSELASLRATAPAPARAMHGARPAVWIVALGAALLAGFAAGYATLARRIRRKYGGLRVY